MAQGRTAVFKAADPDAKTDGEFSTEFPFPGTYSICPQALAQGPLMRLAQAQFQCDYVRLMAQHDYHVVLEANWNM